MSSIDRAIARMTFIAALIFSPIVAAQTAEPAIAIKQTLENIAAIVRPGRVGYATIWDGNRYVQCRRLPDGVFRCEAAGTVLQPSLKAVLTGERLNRLAARGWSIDPAFGNYVRLFPASMTTSAVADQILKTLTEGYDANTSALEFRTAWVADIPCPPRNGPSQNLAGLISDSIEVRSFAIRTCSYKAPVDQSQKVSSAEELIQLSGLEATAEIQRLRINANQKKIWVVFDAGIGYVQCTPEFPEPALYCEAQSAESWPALEAVLTPERVAKLRSLGYADPGRAPNYWKEYAFGKFSDSDVAGELLTILVDVYGYTGARKFAVKTEDN